MFTAFMVALTLTTVANVLVTMAARPAVHGTSIARVFSLATSCPLPHLGAIVVAGAGIGWMYGCADEPWGAGQMLIGSLVALCVPIAGAVQWTVTQRSAGPRRKSWTWCPACWWAR
jgi:hypothetical protein